MANVLGYIANVGKSIGYSTIEYSKSKFENINQFKETNSDLFKSAYKDITSGKVTTKKIGETIKSTKIYEAGDAILKSAREDIRTGKFYNKKRNEEMLEKSFGGLGDDDFNFDDMDMGFDDNWDTDLDGDIDNLDSSKPNKVVRRGPSEVELSSQSNAEAVSSSVLTAAQYSGEISKQNTNLLYTQNAQAYSMFSNQINGVNNSINQIVPIVDITKTIGENQKKYFEETGQLMKDQVALLREIKEGIAEMRPSNKKKNRTGKMTVEDIMTSGVPDLKKYMKAIKDNFDDEFGMLDSVMGMFGDEGNPLLAAAGSPLSFLTGALVKKAVPKALDKSFKSLDKSFSSLFGSLMTKFNTMAEDMEGNIISQTIGKLFRVDSGLKKSLNTSNYNKGRVYWTGKDSKALTEVIPQQISQIISLLSGMPEKIFDYDNGKFVDATQLQQGFKSTLDSFKSNALYDTENKLIEKANKNVAFDNRADQEELLKDIKNMLSKVYEDNKLFDVNKKIDYMDYNISSEKNLQIIKGLFQDLSKGEQLALNREVNEQRARQNSFLKNMEQENSAYKALFNNSGVDKNFKFDEKTRKTYGGKNALINTSGLNTKDNLGHNGFWYLQNILQELRFMRSNWGNGGFSGGGKGKKGKYTLPSIDEYKIKNDKKYDDYNYMEEIRKDERYERDYQDLKDKTLNPNEIDDEKIKSRVINRLNDTNEKKRLKDKYNFESGINQFLLDMQDTEEGKAKMKRRIEKMTDTKDKPFDLANVVVDKVDDAMYRIIYGSPKTQHQAEAKQEGFLNNMTYMMKSKMAEWSLWMEDHIFSPLEEKLSKENLIKMRDSLLEKLGLTGVGTKIKEFFFGDKDGKKGLFTDVVNSVKDNFKGAKDSVKDAFGNVFGGFASKFKGKDRFSKFDKNESKAADDFSNGLANTISDYIHGNIPFYAEGTARVQQATVGVIGKDEMVLPADLANKLREYVLGAGGKLKEGIKTSDVGRKLSSQFNGIISKDMFKNNIDKISSILGNDEVTSGMDNKQKQTYFNMIKEVINARTQDNDPEKEKSKAQKFAGDVMSELGNAGTQIINLFTNGNKKEQTAFGKVLNDVTGNISDYAPDMIGKAMMGGGISLITGAIGGPLVGAAVGAGISLIKKSDKVQSFLFGTEDEETGETKGGILSNTFIGKMRKILPDLKSFGIVGGIAGLTPFMPFGPITGLMLGGTMGYLKNNKKFQERIFGEEGLLNPDRKEKLKKALPKMGAGALVGTMMGPFGLLGNALIGSGAGFVTSTDKFQEMLLGKKDKDGNYTGGLLSSLQTNYIEPLKGKVVDFGKRQAKWFKTKIQDRLEVAMKPLGKQVEVIAKSIGDHTKRVLEKIFTNTIGVPMSKLFKQMSKPLLNVFNKLTFIPRKLIKTAISSPFKAVESLGTSLKKRQIKKGNATYMTAQERLDYRNKNKLSFATGDNFRAFDEALVSISQNNPEALKEMQSGIKNIQKDYKKTKDARQQEVTNLGKTVSGSMGYFTSKKIMKKIIAGDYEGAKKMILNDKNLSDNQRQKLLSQVESKLGDFTKADREFMANNKSYKELISGLKKQGVNTKELEKLGPSALSKYSELISTEMKGNKKLNKKEESPEEQMASTQEKIKEEMGTQHKETMGILDNILFALQNPKNPIKGKNKVSKVESQRDEDGKEFHIDSKGNKVYNKGDALTNKLLSMNKNKPEEEKEEKSGVLKVEKDEEKGIGSIFSGKNIVKGIMSMGIIGKIGLAVGGVLLAKFAPKIKDFFVDKVAPWVTNTAIPFVVKGIGSAIISGGKALVNFLLDELTALYNSTLGTVFPKINRKKSDNSQTKNLASDKNKTNPSSGVYKADPQNVKTTVDRDNRAGMEFDGNMYVEANPEDYTQPNDPSRGTVAIARNIITGGRTGNIKGITEKVSTVGSKVGKVADLALHPIKNIRNLAISKATGKEFKTAKSLTGRVITGSTNLTDKVGRVFGKMSDKVAGIQSKLDSKIVSTKLGGKVTQGLANAGNKVAESSSLITNVMEGIENFLGKLFSNEKVMSLIGADKCSKILSKFVPGFLMNVEKNLVKNVAKISGKLASLATTGGLLNIAFAVVDFISGYRNAQSILGITSEPSFGMKVACGLMKAINGLFIVLSFIPESTWVDIICDQLLPLFGQEDTELQKLRQQSREELDKYNKENNVDLSMDDYIKQTNEKKSSSTGFFNKVKTGISKVGSFFKGVGRKISSFFGGNKNDSNTDNGNGGPNESVLKGLQFNDTDIATDAIGLGGPNKSEFKKFKGIGGGSKHPPVKVKYKDEFGNSIGGPIKPPTPKFEGMGGGEVRTVKGIPLGTAELAPVYDKYDETFKKAGQRYGIDPEFVKALSMQESGGDPNNNNGAALGLMQIEYTLGQEFADYGKQETGTPYTLADRADPEKAIPFGTSRLVEDLKRYNGDYLKATQAYNFSHYSLDALLKAFPNGDDWLDQRANVGKYNGTGLSSYGDPKYIEHVFRYYHGNAIKSDGTANGDFGSSSSSSSDSQDSGNSSPGIAGFFSELGNAASGFVNGLYGIKTDSGSSGSTGPNSNSSVNGASVSASGTAKTVLEGALSYLGDPYVWGGNGEPLTEQTVNSYKGTSHDISSNPNWKSWLGKPGVDCSGLTQQAYKKAGIDITRTTYTQINQGTSVSGIDNAKPTDLLLFGHGGNPTHVGMYLGDGKFIEAPKSGDVVKISDASSRAPMAIRRIITDGSIDNAKVTVGNTSSPDNSQYTKAGDDVGGPDWKYPLTSSNGVGGPVDNFFSKSLGGRVTSNFGKRKGRGKISSNHTGIDIATKRGTPIKSPIEGTVVRKEGIGGSNGYGNLLVVKDKNNADHYFGHMESQSNLKPGDKVKAGDKVGMVGSTGNSTGDHLHYEVRDHGQPIDPNSYYKGQGGSTKTSSDNDKVLQAILKALLAIVDNTAKLDKVIEALQGNTKETATKEAKQILSERDQAVQQAKSLASSNKQLSQSVYEIMDLLGRD